MARIHSLDALPRLLALTASHTAQLLNVSDLAAPFQMTRQTIHDYVTVLERVLLVDRLPPWHRNRLTRLVKAPKLHMGDTGLACALLGIDALALYRDRDRLGPLLETFVLQELRRGSTSVAGVEVKAAASVTEADFRGLRKLRDAAGRQFAAGVVLYDGTSAVRFAGNLFAVPLRILWGDP